MSDPTTCPCGKSYENHPILCAADAQVERPPSHRAVQDINMTIADGLSRCECGRTIAEVGTVNDRRWLHVEEPWNGAAQPSRDATLDVERLVRDLDADLARLICAAPYKYADGHLTAVLREDAAHRIAEWVVARLAGESERG